MRLYKTVLAGALLLLPWQGRAQLVINEIMQGNIDNLYVEGDFPDSWVELYNPGEYPIDLNGYSIGLSKDDVYTFSVSYTVEPGDHVVVYCDKVGSGLHTDFRVDAGKGELYLLNSSDVVVDQLSHKKQLAPNISYGRETDGSDKWGYLLGATPGEPNSGATTSTLLPQPKFSADGGLYTEPFTLTIMVEGLSELPSDAILCVTTDGREPGPLDAVELNAAGEYSFEIESSVAVRAKMFSSEAQPQRSATHSYIYHPEATEMAVVST